jgi:hypothetical protein
MFLLKVLAFFSDTLYTEYRQGNRLAQKVCAMEMFVSIKILDFKSGLVYILSRCAGEKIP